MLFFLYALKLNIVILLMHKITFELDRFITRHGGDTIGLFIRHKYDKRVKFSVIYVDNLGCGEVCFKVVRSLESREKYVMLKPDAIYYYNILKSLVSVGCVLNRHDLKHSHHELYHC